MDWETIKNWLITNIRQITYLVGTIVGVLVLAAVATEFMKHREQKAVEALYVARQSVEALPTEKRAAEGSTVLQKIAADYKRTRAAYEALIAIGDLYSDEKNYGEAAKFYDQAAQAAPDDFARVMALYNKAGSEEFAGNCGAAIESYGKLQTNKQAKFLAPEAMLAQGRCHETLKQYAKASEVYQKIQNEYPNNPYYSNAAQVFLEKIKPMMKN